MADAITTSITSPDLAALHKTLKAMEGNFQGALRRSLKQAANEGLVNARSAAGWSKRIPGSLSTKVSFSTKSAGVKVVADPKRAPNARPLEHGGQPGNLKHPVYGNRKVWVSQPPRPFFYQSFNKDKATAAITAAIQDVIRQAGFK